MLTHQQIIDAAVHHARWARFARPWKLLLHSPSPLPGAPRSVPHPCHPGRHPVLRPVRPGGHRPYVPLQPGGIHCTL
jgi:hypothetical protein